MKRLLSVILAVLLIVSALPTFVFAEGGDTSLTVWDGTAASGFESGSGTEDDPYIIKTAEQLAFLAQSVNGGESYRDEYFRLENDILLNDVTDCADWGNYDEEGNIIAPVNEWVPIGNYDNSFYGYFDGNGHTVSGLYINKSEQDYVGLFGYADSYHPITGLGIINSYIYGNNYVGAVAGRGKVQGCYNKADVNGRGHVGGVVGYGDATDCYNQNAVYGYEDYVGGVTGDGDATNCHNSGFVVNYSWWTGGVTGSGDAVNCYNTERVYGSYYVGGVTGSGDATNCYNEGYIHGYMYVGGVVGSGSATGCYNIAEVYATGYWVGGIASSGDATDCYNTGNITGYMRVGGILGNVSKSVTSCYNIGNVEATDSDGGPIIGDGFSDSEITDCYYLNTSLNGDSNTFGTALSDEQMKTAESFGGFNFNGVWELGFKEGYSYPTHRYFGSKIYKWQVTVISEGQTVFDDGIADGGEFTFTVPYAKEGYSLKYFMDSELNRYNVGDKLPVTKDLSFTAVWQKLNCEQGVWDGSVAEGFSGGDGSEANPYLINTPEQLAYFKTSLEDNDYRNEFIRLNADIRLNDSGIPYSDVIGGQNEWFGGYDDFYGSFDGANHTISGIYQANKASGNHGLFYENYGIIKNLTVADSFILSNEGSYVGGIAGENRGTVENCQSSATVIGESYVGGIAGDGDAVSCQNLGTVMGHSYVGGVVGNGAAVDSQNSGTVIGIKDREGYGSDYVGGVVGHGEKEITNCHNTGEVTGHSYVGGIAGGVPDGSVANFAVSDCYNTGNITGNSGVGGIVGEGTVENCYNTGTVSGSLDDDSYGGDGIGGIAGRSYNGIKNCYNKGAVTGYMNVGGIVGDGAAENCYNEGSITAISQNEYDYNYVGGIVGEGAAENCYNAGAVSGNRGVGGIVGAGDGDGIINCYNIGLVSATEEFGPISGSKYGKVENCYYLDTFTPDENDEVAGTALSAEQMKDQNSFGGFNFNGIWEMGFKDGYSYPTLRHLGSKEHLWVITIVSKGETVSSNAYPQSEPYTFTAPAAKPGEGFSYYVSGDKKYNAGEQLYLSEDITLTAAWHKINTGADVWDGSIAESFSGGDGSEANPYLIANGAELALLAKTVNEGKSQSGVYYKLTADIRLNDSGIAYSDYYGGQNEWMTIGYRYDVSENTYTSRVWAGHFDGDGHTISGVYISPAIKQGGLFGNNDGEIKNLNVADSYISFPTNFNIGGICCENRNLVSNCSFSGTVIGKQWTGGIAGSNYSKIENCYNVGNIIGSEGDYGSVGGITGDNDNNATIINCYNEGSITRKGRYGSVGGIAGSNSSKIENCYNVGSITAEADYTDIGGLAGANTGSGDIINCYNAGNVTANGDYAELGGIVGTNNSAITYCYNVGSVTVGGEYCNIGGITAYSEYYISDNYYLDSSVGDGANEYGTSLSDDQMKTAESFTGFDFDEIWSIRSDTGYPYPSLTGNLQVIKYNVTFYDKDGSVIDTQKVVKGEAALAPDMSSRLTTDGEYVYAFDHWSTKFDEVNYDTDVHAVYKRTAIIKFNGRTFDLGRVENGYSRENLRIDLESYYSDILSVTTNGYAMVCRAEWDISSYNPSVAGQYTLIGRLVLTDSPYYSMADGMTVTAKITVIGSGNTESGSKSDFTYNTEPDGSISITSYTGSAGDVVIPEKIGGKTVTAIADGAFADSNIRTVFIPASVKAIGKNAFTGCSSLVSVVFSDGLTSVGEKAFLSCTLTSVTLPQSVTEIGEHAFGYDSNLVQISGFTVYGMNDAAKAYATDNVLDYSSLSVQEDTATGITALVEEGYTLNAATVSEGLYYETAAGLSEAEKVSVYNIKIDSAEQEDVQPGNVMKISVKLPADFNPENIKIYRINSDGSIKDMKAEIIDDTAVFYVSHLSYYALIETNTRPGDVNGDGSVDTSDLADVKLYLAGALGEKEFSLAAADMDNNKIVDTVDLSALKIQLAGA